MGYGIDPPRGRRGAGRDGTGPPRTPHRAHRDEPADRCPPPEEAHGGQAPRPEGRVAPESRAAPEGGACLEETAREIGRPGST
jgi:hypothetical protein